MTDSTGIFQHASFTAPNPAEGYCTDDNARALILAVLLGQLEEAPKRVRALATTYAAFLDYAFDPKTARFHNFLEYRPPLARRTGVRRLSWPGDLGVGHGGGALAALEFADDGRTALRAGAAGRDGLHFAARLGIQPDWHSRISAPDEG